MITATFNYSGNQIVSVKTRGHANFAPLGKDIVCAAVSVLTITIAQSILLNTDSLCECDLGPGQIDLEVLKGSDGVDLLVKTLLDGLELIVEQYPENLKVRINDEGRTNE